MRFFYKTFLALTLFMASQAQSFTPESGIWWNPDESGSGYAIEIQDNFIFIALYVYDDFGNPIWYTAANFIDGNSFFDSVLDYHYNGTCIDCGYSAPITINGERGPITIDFLTETTATIQFQGAIKNIERFNFFLGDEVSKMRGQWHVIVDPTNIYPDDYFFADVLIFDDEEVFDGLDMVTGCRSESTTFSYCTPFANLSDVAAYYNPDNGYLYAVIDHSNSHYLTYKIKTGLNQFDGEAYIYLKGDVPDFSVEGYIVRGFRSASQTYIDTGAGPSLTVETDAGTDQKSVVRTNSPKLPLSKVLNGSVKNTEKLKQYAIIKKLEQMLEHNSTGDSVVQ